MAAAVIVRAVVIARANGMINGDEAVLGIQALQVLQGHHPIYFSGQPYMGAVDAYLLAPFVDLLGPTAWALRLPVLLEGVVFVPVMGLLAWRLFGPRSVLPAMVLTAIPTPYVTIGELRVLGGYMETLLLGAVTLLLGVPLITQIGRSRPSVALVAAFGFVVGLGFWIYPGYLVFPAALATWALPLVVLRLWHMRRTWSEWPKQGASGMALFLVSAAVGFSPAIGYALKSHGSNIAWLVSVTGLSAVFEHGTASTTSPGGPLHAGQLWFALTTGLPRLVGYDLPWSAASASWWQYTGLLVAAASIVYCLARSAFRLTWAWRNRRDIGIGLECWTPTLPILLIVLATVAYWRSPIAIYYAAPTDLTGRYLLPAVPGILLALAVTLGDIGVVLRAAGHAVRLPNGHRLLNRIGALPERDVHRIVGWFTACVPVCILAVLLVGEMIQYRALNVPWALQSPSRESGQLFDTFPASDAQIVPYLEAHHIRYLWGDRWFNYVIEYLSGGQVTAADYLYGERFWPNIGIVYKSDRPSYLLLVDPALGEPDAVPVFERLGVTYTVVKFEHFWLVTPRSRSVYPAELGSSLTYHH